jgi:hypothetical protein
MPDDPPYRVSWSRKAVEALKEMGQRASAAGRATALAQLVRTIDERLRREPLTFGEVYRARGAVEEHLAAREYLAVDFAVDTARKFVLVRNCKALSGHGL